MIQLCGSVNTAFAMGSKLRDINLYSEREYAVGNGSLCNWGYPNIRTKKRKVASG